MTDNIITLSIGGIPIGIHSGLELKLSRENRIFLISNTAEDVSIHVHFTKDMPVCKGTRCGSDLLFHYYRDEHYRYMQAQSGTDGSVSLAIYTPDFTECNLYINESAFPNTIRTLDKVLQLLPIKQLLSNRNILMLHSSRIRVDQKAILFTAPSKTGKTTQARLWNRYENAVIVSSDRSLIRKAQNAWCTYGYPVDGSDPIYDNQPLPLGAVVILKQSDRNEVLPLSVTEAFKHLMSQTVTDPWDIKQQTNAIQLWLDLMNQYPVYLLRCRPDQESVCCLKEQLIRDKVIGNGKRTR